jgi:hypothetical protein
LLTPFGTPDAANEQEPEPGYVVLPRLSAHVLLATAEGDSAARVIVGRSGAGKTKHLKELRRRLEQEGTCDLMPLDFGPPNLTPVTRLANEIGFSGGVERVEMWRKLWRRAIVRAVIPHLLDEDDRDGSLAATVRQNEGGLLGSIGGPRSITFEFEQILNENSSPTELRTFIGDDSWHKIDRAVGVALARRRRPLCFFVDIVEEESAFAPLQWHSCMKGLLRQILRFIRKPLGSGDNLRIYIAIREQTWFELGQLMSGILEQHPAVRVLRWQPDALLEFFAQKIVGLPPQYTLQEIDPEAPPKEVVAAWLGSPTVPNSARPHQEAASTYILRHTRLIPRDIVVVGNVLAREVSAARQQGRGCVEPKRIQAAVSGSAAAAALEELQWCALEIISNWLSTAEMGEEKLILPDEEARGRLASELAELLRSSSADIIEAGELNELARKADRDLGRPADFKQILWRHGLIGWGPSAVGPWNFSHRVGLSSREAPPAEDSYVAMHPALIDAIAISPTGDSPVNPFSED